MGKNVHQIGKYIPNDHKLYQMVINKVQTAVKYVYVHTKWSYNIPIFSIPRPSKIHPNRNFSKHICILYVHMYVGTCTYIVSAQQETFRLLFKNALPMYVDESNDIFVVVNAVLVF
jgi:hypothetical protein